MHYHTVLNPFDKDKFRVFAFLKEKVLGSSAIALVWLKRYVALKLRGIIM